MMIPSTSRRRTQDGMRASYFAPHVGYVRIRRGLCCPCGRELEASDFSADDESHTVSVVCGGCHVDLIEIEW
jgi:hypothetical protein